jgi:hypothetical protein
VWCGAWFVWWSAVEESLAKGERCLFFTYFSPSLTGDARRDCEVEGDGGEDGEAHGGEQRGHLAAQLGVQRGAVDLVAAVLNLFIQWGRRGRRGDRVQTQKKNA